MQLDLQPPAGGVLHLLDEGPHVAGVEVAVRIGRGDLPAGLRGGVATDDGGGGEAARSRKQRAAGDARHAEAPLVRRYARIFGTGGRITQGAGRMGEPARPRGCIDPGPGTQEMPARRAAARGVASARGAILFEQPAPVLARALCPFVGHGAADAG